MKKNRQSQGKVVLFPGMVERMFAQAKELTEQHQYQEANERFEQALLMGEGDELSLSVYAYSLYETKSYERAKQVCEDLLAVGPTMYFEVMELYLTICMQLRQFKQVEKIIETLLDEALIPEEQISKFQRLKNLNADIAENQLEQFEQTEPELDTIEFDAIVFLQLPFQQQLIQIHELTEKNIRPFVTEIIKAIETASIHPFIQSLLLIVLVEQQVNDQIVLHKFGNTETVNPAQLQLPTKLPQYQEIMLQILEMLEQSPSMLEVAQQLVAKHAIIVYPFEWKNYDSTNVAMGYVQLVKSMFGEVMEMDLEIDNFLRNLENMSDL